MKINKEELNKPITKKQDGDFATLKEVIEEDIIIKDNMSSEDFRDLSIARYKAINADKAIILGSVSYTKKQIIDEIERKTEVGDKFIAMQVKFIRMLLDNKNNIDIT